MQVDLKDKVAVVTGCENDIGYQICRVLAQNGAIVYAQSCDDTATQKLTEKIIDEHGVAYPLVGDISDIGAVDQMVKTICCQHGHIDILVNNTDIQTISHEKKEIHEYSDAVWEDTVVAGMRGFYDCTKCFSKLMIERGSGRIINIASAGAIVGLQKHSAMVTVASGIAGFTRALAAELGKYGVLVNTVAPGAIENVSNTDDNQALLGHIPLGRKGTAQEVANTVAFLSAPEASYMTGATITIDGGWSCGFMRDW